MYDSSFLFDKSVENNLKRLGAPQQDLTDSSRLAFLAKYLSMFPFFRRISSQKIAAIADKIKIVTKQKDELVIIPPHNQVMVILNGQIVMREH